jgi:hypothetical protein
MTKKDDSAPDAPTPSLVRSDAEKRPPEAWFEAKKSRAWAFDGAKFARHWPDGIEITEAAYDAAIKAVEELPLGSPSVLVKKPAKAAKRGKRWLSRR